MSFQVLVTSHADRQLAECACWWAQHRSLEQAQRWLDGFEARISSLTDNPSKHARAPENDFYELPFVVRQILYGLGNRPTHRAVFEIRGNTVYVLSIRHLAQDFLKREEF